MRAILALIVFAGMAPASEPPSGFTALFNGKDLAGWHGMPDYDLRKLAVLPEDKRNELLGRWMAEVRAHWSVKDGELINDGHGAFLTTDKNYGDIELLVEYRTVAKADSGIYLRGLPQVQIWDYTDPEKFKHGADKGSGGLWNNSKGTPGKDPLVPADKPFGQWNSFRIVQVGERTTVFLNDKLVVNHARMEHYYEKDRRNPLPRVGPVQLQTHGGEIRFRNVFVREIDARKANELLVKSDADGFREVFNGKNFAGWNGPVENFEVNEGAIICRPKKGGTIFTAEEFGDFVARVEFKLPPGGNNGFAIRYPGTGDTAYDGMCEIQVLDDSSPDNAKLDPRQFNGSPYGMVASHRGYLRPVGEWNFEEITVRGSTVVVELNGTRILDCDLSKVTNYLENKPHPGKDRTTGHFGLAGHDDPVAFRNIRIKRLDGTK